MSRNEPFSVARKATHQVRPRLFGRFQKKNSAKFAVASDSSTHRQTLGNRLCCTRLGSKRSDLVAVVAPMCIKGLHLVTVQLPKRFSPIGLGTNRTSP